MFVEFKLPFFPSNGNSYTCWNQATNESVVVSLDVKSLATWLRKVPDGNTIKFELTQAAYERKLASPNISIKDWTSEQANELELPLVDVPSASACDRSRYDSCIFDVTALLQAGTLEKMIARHAQSQYASLSVETGASEKTLFVVRSTRANGAALCTDVALPDGACIAARAKAHNSPVIFTQHLQQLVHAAHTPTSLTHTAPVAVRFRSNGDHGAVCVTYTIGDKEAFMTFYIDPRDETKKRSTKPSALPKSTLPAAKRVKYTTSATEAECAECTEVAAAAPEAATAVTPSVSSHARHGDVAEAASGEKPSSACAEPEQKAKAREDEEEEAEEPVCAGPGTLRCLVCGKFVAACGGHGEPTGRPDDDGIHSLLAEPKPDNEDDEAAEECTGPGTLRCLVCAKFLAVCGGHGGPGDKY
jgi:hypothetical protein